MTNHKNYLVVLSSGINKSSVALYCLDTKQYIQQFSQPSQVHADQLLVMLDRCLLEVNAQPSNLVGIVANHGPGSFTGIRVACSIAQGVALGLEIPVYGLSALNAQLFAVSSLDLLSESDVVLSVLDARMGELYACVYQYEQGNWVPEADAFLLRIEDFELWVNHYKKNKKVHIVGQLGCVYPDIQVEALGVNYTEIEELEASYLIKPAMMAYHQGQFYQPEQLQPLYIRDKIAFTIQERESGQGGNPKARPWRSGS